MIVLFTDFGADDLYVGQVKAALLERAPAGTAIVDLLHSVPSFHPRAGAHLLAALQARFPAGTVFFAVIDPGVGTDRDAAVLQADGKWYVGPDNGLLSVVAARAATTQTWRIAWRPPALSASFHGRDLFAPVATDLARPTPDLGKLEQTRQLHVRRRAGRQRVLVREQRRTGRACGESCKRGAAARHRRRRPRPRRRLGVGDGFNVHGLTYVNASRAAARRDA